jgi:hypothetical protein
MFTRDFSHPASLQKAPTKIEIMEIFIDKVHRIMSLVTIEEQPLKEIKASYSMEETTSLSAS